MTRRYCIDTSVSFGTDGEPDYVEMDVTLSYTVEWGCPAQTYGPPENCFPAEPDEIDDIRVEAVNGKPPPFEMFASDADAQTLIIEALGEDHLADMLSDAADEDAADYDDAMERRWEERRMERD